MINSHVRSLDTIRKRIATHRGLGLSWRKISALTEFGGSSAGLLCNILKGYEPKSPETRRKLRLPPLAVLVDPCPTCGDKAHGYDCSKQSIIEKPAESKRVYKRKRTYPDYAKMRTNDIAQAVRQFEKHYPEYEITKKENK